MAEGAQERQEGHLHSRKQSPGSSRLHAREAGGETPRSVSTCQPLTACPATAQGRLFFLAAEKPRTPHLAQTPRETFSQPPPNTRSACKRSRKPRAGNCTRHSVCVRPPVFLAEQECFFPQLSLSTGAVVLQRSPLVKEPQPLPRESLFL